MIMEYQPFVRIFLRYAVGAIATMETGEILASDPDVVSIVTLGISLFVGAVTEFWYRRSKKSGGAT